MYTVKTLFEMYQVSSLGFLKVDTEGHDGVVLNSYMDWLACGGARAKQVLFESNVLIDKEVVDRVIERMTALGYVLVSRGEDTVMRCD